jgi:hypothetical protein
VPKAARRKFAFTTEDGDAVMTAKRAWEPGTELKPWVFRLGLVVQNTGGLDTNIPARSH